jgi:FkbM family methyltransferase
VSTTFSLVAANVESAGLQNVTLVNAAVSDSTMLARMEIPHWAGETIKNLYQAHLSDSGRGALVLCLPLDSLSIPSRVALVKIDAEGFDEQVLSGMRHLLDRDKPRLIVEMGAHEVPAFVRDIGLSGEVTARLAKRRAHAPVPFPTGTPVFRQRLG